MKIRLLAVLVAVLFVLLESRAASQTLGSALSLPYAIRVGGEVSSGGVTGKTKELTIWAPGKTKRIRVCVNRRAGPTTVCIRTKVVTVARNTCRTWFSNKEVTKRWGIPLPTRTVVTLKLPTGVNNTSGWIHFLNT